MSSHLPIITAVGHYGNGDKNQPNVIALTDHQKPFQNPSDSEEWIAKEKSEGRLILFRKVFDQTITTEECKGSERWAENDSTRGYNCMMQFKAEMLYSEYQSINPSSGKDLWYTNFGKLHQIPGINLLHVESRRQTGKGVLMELSFEIHWFQPKFSRKKEYPMPDFLKTMDQRLRPSSPDSNF